MYQEEKLFHHLKKEDKAKIIENLKLGTLLKAEVKGYNFGCFNVNGELDVLFICKNFWFWVNHPDEVFNIGEKHDLKVISVDKEKLQVGCSVKQLSPDPTDTENYELNKIYKVKGQINGFWSILWTRTWFNNTSAFEWTQLD